MAPSLFGRPKGVVTTKPIQCCHGPFSMKESTAPSLFGTEDRNHASRSSQSLNYFPYEYSQELRNPRTDVVARYCKIQSTQTAPGIALEHF